MKQTFADQPPSSAQQNLLELKRINLDYGSVRALSSINIDVRYSEVHAIVGEHGAGKSSLGMIISGAVKPNSGDILFKGRKYVFLSPERARGIGIEMVYQHIDMNAYSTIAENFIINSSLFTRLPFINQGNILRDVRGFLEGYGFKIKLSGKSRDLNLSDQTLVEILKSIYRNPSLLIIDEALEKLTPSKRQRIVQILNELKKDGLSVLFITHRIDDIYQFADRVTIVKNGSVILTDSVKNIDKINLIKITYSQFSKKAYVANLSGEFHQLLKYNEAILRHLPVNLIVTDSEHRVKMINEYGKNYFGVKRRNYLNKPIDGIFKATQGNEAVLDILKNKEQTRKVTTHYNVVIDVNGSKTLNNIITYHIYEGDFPIGDIIIIEDITKQEKLRQQVILSEKLASIGLLAAGVAHEINTPLGIIYNYIRRLKNRAKDQTQQQILNELSEEIDYINHIIKNLISLSDKGKAVDERFDVNELMRNIINLFKHTAESRNIAIRFRCPREPVELRANVNEMKQVILNLIKNSFEAMPEGGEIDIETSESLEDDRRVVRVFFSDTGCGITEEDADDIFLPFYSTKRGKGDNIGLGLSLSYGIIKKYGGSISVKNLPERGCVFTIEIPET